MPEIQPKQTTSTSCEPDKTASPEALPKRFVVVTTDKASYDFAFIYKIYYISKLLTEVSLCNSKFKTCSKTTHSI